MIAKVYHGFRSLASVKVTKLIDRIDIKTMNNNNTAGLSIICNKHYAIIIVIITPTLKSGRIIFSFFDAGCTKPFFLFKVM